MADRALIRGFCFDQNSADELFAATFVQPDSGPKRLPTPHPALRATFSSKS
jgi:hypothetical protein